MTSISSSQPFSTIRQPARRQLFAVLWLSGMIGVLAFVSGPLPLPVDAELPVPLTVIRLISLLQSGVLLALAVAAGVAAAPAVGLRAPVVEALLTGHAVMPVMRRLWRPAVGIGLLGGALGWAIGILAAPALPAPVAEAGGQALNLSLPVRLLYGGVTEELLLRWGWMSAVVWLLWRLTGRRGERPGATRYGVGIVIAALTFGALHLPFASVLAGGLTPFLVLYVVGLNALLGIIFGWLFWRHGLAAAIIAHMMFHIFVVTAAVVVG